MQIKSLVEKSEAMALVATMTAYLVSIDARVNPAGPEYDADLAYDAALMRGVVFAKQEAIRAFDAASAAPVEQAPVSPRRRRTVSA